MQFTWPWAQTARQSMLIRVQYLHVQTCITSPSEGHCSVNCVLSFVQREYVTSHKWYILSYFCGSFHYAKKVLKSTRYIASAMCVCVYVWVWCVCVGVWCVCGVCVWCVYTGHLLQDRISLTLVHTVMRPLLHTSAAIPILAKCI